MRLVVDIAARRRLTELISRYDDQEGGLAKMVGRLRRTIDYMEAAGDTDRARRLRIACVLTERARDILHRPDDIGPEEFERIRSAIAEWVGEPAAGDPVTGWLCLEGHFATWDERGTGQRCCAYCGAGGLRAASAVVVKAR